jgi:hypothetical protein
VLDIPRLFFGHEHFITVDSLERLVTAHGRERVCQYTVSDTFEHPHLPGFRFSMEAMFDDLRIH